MQLNFEFRENLAPQPGAIRGVPAANSGFHSSEFDSNYVLQNSVFERWAVAGAEHRKNPPPFCAYPPLHMEAPANMRELLWSKVDEVGRKDGTLLIVVGALTRDQIKPMASLLRLLSRK